MKINECSHGKTWKEECPHCEMIWWLDVRGHAIRNLARADKHIAELNKVLGTQALCQARQTSDQMTCEKCGIAWDMNDPLPPRCPAVTN